MLDPAVMTGPVGVVADDTTGAGDIGMMFTRSGLRVVVVAHDAPDPLPADVDVLILDTDSRLDPPATAAAKVKAATERLMAKRARPLHKKTCSVLRGPVGAEFDALLNAAQQHFMVVSVAYPQLGRQTRAGMHSVNGIPLAETAFARDPAHPAVESNLVKLLQSQTARPVYLVALDVVRSGSALLRAELVRLSARGGYAVVDGETQADIRTLAEAVFDFPVLGGSAALAEELPAFWPKPTARLPAAVASQRGTPAPVLVVAGSLTPVTRQQTLALTGAGTPTITLDPVKVVVAQQRAKEIERVVELALAHMKQGRDTLVLADPTEQAVAATRELAHTNGLDSRSANKAVSAALADVTHAVLAGSGAQRLIIAGGDTSGTICRRLGISGTRLLGEIEPGVPASRALGRDLLLVLKSGSFGTVDFLAKAITYLKNLHP